MGLYHYFENFTLFFMGLRYSMLEQVENRLIEEYSSFVLKQFFEVMT